MPSPFEVIMEKLGLGHSPEKIDFLFVGEAEDATGTTPWYKWNHDANVAIPIHEDALTGYIYNITINTKEFKGKKNYKLNIHVQADHKYQIRCGAGTTFARGLVLSLHDLLRLEGPQALKEPVTISVKQGDEGSKAVFCGIYYKDQKWIPAWNTDSLSEKIKDIQKAMGQVVQTKEMMDDSEVMYQAAQAHKEKQASLDAKVKPIKETKRKIEEVKDDDSTSEQ